MLLMKVASALEGLSECHSDPCSSTNNPFNAEATFVKGPRTQKIL